MTVHDDEHDAWLREALRHAPDANIGAPPALSDTILRQARAAAVASAPAPVQRGALRTIAEFWTWLTRPVIATGFAGVMAATLVGMLWWGRPMDEAAMPPPPTAVARVAKAPTAASDQATTAAEPAAALKPVVVAAAAPAPATDHAAAAIMSPRERRAEPPRASAKAAAPAQREDARVADASPHDRQMRREAPASAAPMPLPPPAQDRPALAQATAPSTQVAVAAPAAQSLAGARAEADTSASEAKAAPRGAGSTARVAIARPPTGALLADRARSEPLQTLRAAIRAEPERWRWQRGEGSAQAMTPALQAWLAQLDDGLPAPTSGHTAPAAPTLRLLRDGQPHTSLALGPDSLRLTPADAAQPALQWPLSPAAAAALNAALDTATR